MQQLPGPQPKNVTYMNSTSNTKVVRCITFANRYANVNILYKKHSILRLNELRHYGYGKHMSKLHNNQTSLQISNLFAVGIVIIRGIQQKKII